MPEPDDHSGSGPDRDADHRVVREIAHVGFDAGAPRRGPVPDLMIWSQWVPFPLVRRRSPEELASGSRYLAALFGPSAVAPAGAEGAVAEGVVAALGPLSFDPADAAARRLPLRAARPNAGLAEPLTQDLEPIPGYPSAPWCRALQDEHVEFRERAGLEPSYAFRKTLQAAKQRLREAEELDQLGQVGIW